MLLFVGLGNPGKKYDNNRHNIGFMAVDEIVRRHNFSAPKSKFQGIIFEGQLGEQKVLVLKPQTFMNLSGKSVAEAAHYYKIQPENIIVFYDELDVPAGKVKFKTGGGTAGHNGIRSIAQYMGNDFHRVRFGISHPGDKNKVTGHVLGDFSKEDYIWLEPMLDAVSRAAPELDTLDGQKFLNAVGLILKPNQPKSTDIKNKE
jgi:peptidyl-tRNA hydrolase, PTH1 family